MSYPTLRQRLLDLRDCGIEVWYKSVEEPTLSTDSVIRISGKEQLLTDNGLKLDETFEPFGDGKEHVKSEIRYKIEGFDRELYNPSTRFSEEHKSRIKLKCLVAAKLLDNARGGNLNGFQEFLLEEGFGVNPDTLDVHRIYDPSTKLEYTFILPKEELTIK